PMVRLSRVGSAIVRLAKRMGKSVRAIGEAANAHLDTSERVWNELQEALTLQWKFYDFLLYK
ncbi:MAG: hypothetical protein RL536_239, partial [Candidatus Parcubacteria bacterium]